MSAASYDWTDWDMRGSKPATVLTNGCFDLFHAGHVDLLAHCRRLGDKVVVAVNSDEMVTALKGEGRPVIPLIERVAVLRSCRHVDEVVTFGEEWMLEELITMHRPDVLVKGGDYKEDEITGAELVRSWGGRVVLIPHLYPQSTSKILQKIESRLLEGEVEVEFIPEG